MLSRLHLLSLIAAVLLISCGQQESPGTAQDTVAAPNVTVPSETEASQAPSAMPFVIYPAQVRELASQDVLERGEAVYEGLCRACHGADLRGGDMGGPNLLRSQLVLNDEHGELIGEVIQNGRSNPGMPAMPPLQVPAEDRVAVAEFIHSVWANQSFQGGPPGGAEVELDIVVGDAAAGEAFFNQRCTGCHSLSGDLAGIASRIDTPVNLQNSWVAGRRFGAPDPGADPSRRAIRATVTLGNGEQVSGVLKRQDDFVVSLVTDEGEHRSFSLTGNTRVEINDPAQAHRALLSELTNEVMHDVTAFLVTQQ